MSGRRAGLLALAVACVVPLGAAHADDSPDEGEGRGDNVAVAAIEQDGGRAFDVAWSVQRQRGGVVDQRNTANAAARCSDCRATAIAFQVVLVWGAADQVVPRNQALAINDQCTRCVVYAGARQFVRVTERPVRFTARGRITLAQVRRELAGLEHGDLDATQLAAEVERQEARVREALTEELVPIGEGRRRILDRRDHEDDDD